MIRKCYGCETYLENKSIHFQLDLIFTTYMKDANTNQVEEVTSMFRNNTNYFCPECWDIFIKHLTIFTEKVKGDNRNKSICFTCATNINDEPYYHQINLDLNCFIKNNQHQFQADKKQNVTFYLTICDGCFDILISHIKDATNEFPKCEISKVTNNVITCESCSGDKTSFRNLKEGKDVSEC